MSETTKKNELGCIACANGNDLPDGEECMACGRVGDWRSPVKRNYYSGKVEPVSPLEEAIRKVRGGSAPLPKRGFA